MLDYETAMRWRKGAAERGDKVAQCGIGLMYQAGQGVAQRLALIPPEALRPAATICRNGAGHFLV